MGGSWSNQITTSTRQNSWFRGQLPSAAFVLSIQEVHGFRINYTWSYRVSIYCNNIYSPTNPSSYLCNHPRVVFSCLHESSISGSCFATALPLALRVNLLLLAALLAWLLPTWLLPLAVSSGLHCLVLFLWLWLWVFKVDRGPSYVSAALVINLKRSLLISCIASRIRTSLETSTMMMLRGIVVKYWKEWN